MEKRYIKETYQFQSEIQKSKFIACAYPLAQKEDVKRILQEVRELFPKATYYCYAMIYDEYAKSNDDGEPSSTAGKPIMERLLKKNINHILVVVVRYFGGIKLGASGLIRAYGDACQRVIEKASLYCLELRYVSDFFVDYKDNDIFYYDLQRKKIDIENISYEEKVQYTLLLKPEEYNEIIDRFQNRIEYKVLNEKMVFVKNNKEDDNDK